LKTGQHLAKLEAKIEWFHFFPDTLVPLFSGHAVYTTINFTDEFRNVLVALR